eukprot:1214683-Pyramimonas_sp.AAC.1
MSSICARVGLNCSHLVPRRVSSCARQPLRGISSPANAPALVGYWRSDIVRPTTALLPKRQKWRYRRCDSLHEKILRAPALLSMFMTMSMSIIWLRLRTVEVHVTDKRKSGSFGWLRISSDDKPYAHEERYLTCRFCYR